MTKTKAASVAPQTADPSTEEPLMECKQEPPASSGKSCACGRSRIPHRAGRFR